MTPEKSIIKCPHVMEAVQETLLDAGYPKLTNDQFNIVDDLIWSLTTGAPETGTLHASLKGPAGTGKTTLLIGLIIALDELGLRTVVTSFTHKACSVITSHLDVIKEFLNREVRVLTLHSLLNLKPQKAEYGKPDTFTQSQPPRLHGEVDFVIVDECSMVGKDLTLHIEKGIVEEEIPILYAGDPSQLMPVNESTLSATFKTKKKYELTKILRHDGAVLNLATRIRTMKYLPQVRPDSGGGTDVLVYPNTDALRAAWLKSVTDPDRVEGTVMLCYMNKHRRAFNREARIALMGEDAPHFVDNDVLLTLSPIMQDEKVIYSNNEDVHVVAPPQYLEDFKPILDLDFTCSAWKLRTDKGIVIFVLSEQREIDKYKKYMKALGTEISRQQKAAKTAGYDAIRKVKRRWATEYFPLRDFFADVDFRYALTIHKSQGSTFQNVFVYDDYRQAREQQQRLMYVAVTRASREVHHLDTRVV